MPDTTEGARRPTRDEPDPGRYDEERLAPDTEDHSNEEMPRVHITRERMLLFGLFVISAIAFLYFVLPRFAGLGKTWDRVQEGDPAWLAAAFGLELLSFGGYIPPFRARFPRGGTRIRWPGGYRTTMARPAAPPP